VSSVSPPLAAWCPACRELVAFDEHGRCLWCSEATGGAAPQAVIRARRSHTGKPYLMSEEQIVEARVLYASGLSLRAVARELHPRTAYASVDSLANSIETQFRHRGWALRRLEAVTSARNYRHGLKADGAAYHRWWRARRSTPCAGLRTTYPGRGKPCRRRAVLGGNYCAAHDPARAAERAAHLARARARIGAAA
jgi:hypothetical protein